jgi:hypothetical protein
VKRQNFGQHFEQNHHHSLQMAGRPLRSSSSTFIHPSLNFLYLSLTIPSLITLWPKTAAHNARWISAALMFLREERDNSLNFADRRKYHNSLCREKNKHQVTWFTRQWVIWPYLACASSPPAPTLVAYHERRLLFRIAIEHFSIIAAYMPKSPRWSSFFCFPS